MKKLLSLFICIIFVICTTVYASADTTKDDLIKESSIESFTQKQRESANENTDLINYFIKKYGNTNRSDFEVEDSFPYYYGGSYINTSGELVILVTDSGLQSKSNLEEISNIANDPIIESCEYAYKELNSVMDSIMTNLIELKETKSYYAEQVRCWAIDDEKNCIYVYLKKCDDEIVEWFKREISDSESIVFKVSNGVSEDEVNYSGQGVFTVGPSYFSGAFRVRRGTDEGFKYGFITCAHGNYLESTVYDDNSDYLGTVKLRRYGGAYDVSYVEMNSSNDFSNTITSTPYTLRGTNDDICYPTKGDRVYLYARYNRGSSGTVTSTNVSYINENGVSFSGLVGSNYQSQNGDSGGLICTGATDYGCDLYGVHKGVYEGYKVFTSAFKVVNLWYLNRY